MLPSVGAILQHAHKFALLDFSANLDDWCYEFSFLLCFLRGEDGLCGFGHFRCLCLVSVWIISV